jgi:hypothetical protein
MLRCARPIADSALVLRRRRGIKGFAHEPALKLRFPLTGPFRLAAMRIIAVIIEPLEPAGGGKAVTE